MKISFLIIILKSLTSIITAQNTVLLNYIKNLKEDTIQLDQIQIKGVNLYTTKQMLVDKLGEPDSIVNPNYECGGFSGEWQEKVFLQYFYGCFNFIGTNDQYQIEHIHFEKDHSLLISYKGIVLNHKTRIEEIKTLFPKSYKDRYIKNDKDNTVVVRLLPYTVADDKVYLWFKNGYLIELEYWTPC